MRCPNTKKKRIIKEAATIEEIETARKIYQTEDIEIDDNAAVSRVEIENYGRWVAAWVWVSDEEIGTRRKYMPT